VKQQSEISVELAISVTLTNNTPVTGRSVIWYACMYVFVNRIIFIDLLLHVFMSAFEAV
jgi:hypothetical protein